MRLIKNKTRAATSFGTVILCALVLSACDSGAMAEQTASSTQAWPRTIASDAGSLELSEEPQRVVAMSSDAADAALALIGSERVVAVPELVRDPQQSSQAEAAAGVEGVLASGGDAAAEDIAAFDPDLVLITERHGAEHRIVDQLSAAGLPVLAIGNTWEDPGAFAENLTLIGAALGAEARAEELVADHRQRWDAIAAQEPGGGASVAVLRVIAGQVMLSGSGSITQAVVDAAGLESVAREETRPASAEQLIAAAPETIVLVDAGGSGGEAMDGLLESAGMAAVPAVAEGRVITVSAAEVSSGTGGVAGLERIADALD